MKKNIFFILIGITIIILLINSQLVLKGATTGLILWFKAIIPTLFPFMLLSSVLLDLNKENFISRFLTPITKPIFGISPAGNYVLFIGLLCGYPLGAGTAARLVREGRLNTAEAQYLMNFCNNLSPAFIISFVCGSLLNNSSLIPKLLITLYLTPIILGLLSRHFYMKQPSDSLSEAFVCSFPSGNSTVHTLTATEPFSITGTLDKAISATAETLLKLGTYIIIFTIFSELLGNTPLPSYLKLILTSITEVTGGCKIIAASSVINTGLRLPLLSALITFGGIAGIAQTAGMLSNTELSLKQYLCFRSLSAVIVFIIAYIFF